MDIFSLIYPWVDGLWLVLALLIVHAGQRFLSAMFIALCMGMMRLQAELMDFIGYPYGFFGFIPDYDAFERGLMVYSVFYILFFLMAYYSPGSRGAVFLAASISMFFMALFTSTLVMVI